MQELDWIPEDVRQLYRTAWELPQRALIDMAAARTPYLDQSQSLNLFMAAPTIGKLSSMYAYAWKRGMKTTYYLRSRPATRIARAARGTATTPRAPVPAQRRCAPSTRPPPAPWRTPSPARHASDDHAAPDPPPRPRRHQRNLLDPGFELTLRPMRYPDFYERYRDAIKNTWTVEEVDLHSDVADLAKLSPASST